jgi:Tfp pilus assembly protein PilO
MSQPIKPPIDPPINPPINPDAEFEPQITPEEALLEEQQTVVLAEEGEIPLEVSPEAPSTVVTVDRDVRSGMFGVPETIALAFSCLVLLGVLGFYFLVLAPAQSDLKNRKAQRDEQELKLTELKSRFGNSTKTEEIVASLERSVDDFELRYLPIASIGKTGLYDRINGLMSAYHLRNTSGPDYSPLEISALKANQPQQEERGKTKFQSLFPGVYISMTVEGSYVNLRRFIGEIESSQQFVVVSTVQLEAAENTQQGTQNTSAASTSANPAGGVGMMNGKPAYGQPVTAGQQPARAAAPRGKTMGEMVSLHLELAAYFRREAAPGSALQPLDAPGAMK